MTTELPHGAGVRLDEGINITASERCLAHSAHQVPTITYYESLTPGIYCSQCHPEEWVGIPGRRHLSDQSQVTWLPPGHQRKDWLMELPGTLLTYIVRRCLLGFIIIPPRQYPLLQLIPPQLPSPVPDFEAPHLPKESQVVFVSRPELEGLSTPEKTVTVFMVTCLCAQFEAVLQHGVKRSRGLALTAAAIKQAAGFSSKTETEPVFWFYVKEVLSKHELQRFYALRHIASDVGRGRAWLRCALNEHSLERYLHMLLADHSRLSTFYEDWAFVMDEERSSMLPTMAAGLNSILFAINIDNKDLNGQSKFAPTVSDLLKESTQNVTSLLKESTQGVSSLFREITASSAVSILIRPEQETDPLPVVSKHISADAKCKRERKKKKKVTNIISFDDEEDEQSSGDVFKKIPGAGESSEENSDRSSVNVMTAFESPFGPNSNGSQSSNSWKVDSLSLNGEFGYQKLDVKSIDDEDVDENEDDVYGSTPGKKCPGHSDSPEKPPDGAACLSQMHSWAPLHVLHGDADVLFPVSGVGSYGPAEPGVKRREPVPSPLYCVVSYGPQKPGMEP
ncbi:sorting nexin-29-like [Physeter macrocephalus]|uniref:Sorting nexin-29-like n=1 Tax=Physeter macrocephalus TaxID=9755 RepID=A0A455CA01_PHYMC|nr:sorting nexin-29-like [Physeter catodon]|eukprot:XP_028353821.1 sorting nexin-29-like [Physeter catodon]